MALNIMAGDERLKLYSRDPAEMDTIMESTTDEILRGGDTVPQT
jgi:hypothetical protein